MNGLPLDDLSNTTDLNDDSGLLCAYLKPDGSWQWGSCLSAERHYFVCETHKLYPKNMTTALPIVTSSGAPIDNRQHSGDKPGLTGGAKAGIALGVIGGVAVVLVIGFVAFKRYRPNSPVMTSFENSIYRQSVNRDAHEAAVSWSRS